MDSITKPSPRVLRALVAALLAALLLALNDSAARVQSASAQLPAEGAPVQSEKSPHAEFVAGELLVRYRAGEKGARAAEQLTALNEGGREIPISVERVKGLDLVEGLRLARVPPEETLAAVAALVARPDVLYAEPNYVRRAHAVPNDARYAEQWSLRGGLGVPSNPHVHAEAAWDVTTGSRDVVVGVVDEGIEVNHPDLRDNIWRNPGEVAGNNLDDDGNGYADDVNGWDFFHEDRTVYDNPSGTAGLNAPDAHGTHVAGIVGAAGNNGIGIAGVNWQVRMMSLKVLGAAGQSPAPSSVLLTVRAYAYARRMRELYQSSGGALGANLRVLNNSYGGVGRSQAELDAINELGAAGILFVASAGNGRESDDQSPRYPAGYDAPNLISVAATHAGDGLSDFSNFGARTVHMAAPGHSILSTTPGGTYDFASGTSMAAPHVAGAAALVCAARPAVSVAKLRAALLFGGDPLTTLAGMTVTGRRLNLEGALRLALEDDGEAPAMTNLGVVTQDGRAVTLAWSAPGDDGTSAGQAQLYELRFVGPQPGDSFRLAAFRPAPAGFPQSFTVNVPYRRQAGALVLHAFDDSGNSGAASVQVSVGDAAAEPYAVTEGPAEPLTTGGTHLFIAHDDFQKQVALPFEFPYFERYAQSVIVSTNGALYLSTAPRDDTLSYVEQLEGWPMIAGLWDDLDLRACQRPDADVYVTQDAERVVFRWQGVLFKSVTCPVNPTGDNFNFEVELRRDGTIVQRFGDGNRGAFPVVGISAGEPAAYAVASHTSAFSRLDLTNAPTVTYALRRPVAKTDLAISEHPANFPYPVRLGTEFEVPVTVVNKGPDRAAGVRLTTTLPKEVRLVSCQTTQGVCGSGEGNNARADFGALDAGVTARAVYVFEPTAATHASYILSHKVTSSTHDTSLSDNERLTFVSPGQGNPTPLVGASAVSAGGTFSLALKPDGTVLAWGSNVFGQLGDGGVASFSPQPQGVRYLTGVAAVSAGDKHALALKHTGAVWAWGDNSEGQIGDGTKTARKKPLKVPSLANVTAVAASTHSLAVKSDGTVWAWGPNGSGQLGDGTTTGRTTPVQVQGLSGARAVAAGSAFSVALKSDGTVWAWGANESGQLGDGTNVQRLAPVQVSGLSNVVAVSAGWSHALALRGDGTVWAWGANNAGQLGDTTITARGVPVQVVGLVGVTAVDGGGETSVALRNDGAVLAWGSNFWGMLGDALTSNRSVPAKVVTLKGALGVSAGSEHVLALTGGGTAWGWGSDFSGLLGDGSADGSRRWPFEVMKQIPEPPPVGTVPTPTLSPDGGSFSGPQNVRVRVAGDDLTVRSLASGSVSTIAVASDGNVYAWGFGHSGQLGLEPFEPRPGQTGVREPSPRLQPISDVVAVAASEFNHYAVKSDGTVWAWGKRWGLGAGNLGDGVQLTPVQVPGLTNVKAIACGFNHAVALKSDGTVWTWGVNNEGQLGDGTQETRLSPTQVPGLSGITEIAVKSNSSYALKADGTVWVWGHHDEGQFINAFHKSPVQMPGIADVKSIGAANLCVFAVRQDGTLWAWGIVTNIVRPDPFKIEGLTNVRAARGGERFGVALKEDGTVWVFGWNTSGVLGLGTFEFVEQNNPRQIPELSGVTSIEANTAGVFAVESDGQLWAWGDNRFGQLGDGTFTSRAVPGTIETIAGNIRVHYTTDGREPTDDDPSVPAGGSILVGQDMTLKARAWRDGWTPSGAKSAAFQISTHPIDGNQFFVAQHYRDFLGREADAEGLAFWTAGLDACGTDAGCLSNKRVDTSAAFFLSIEFQETGFLVHRMYKTAYGEADGSALINDVPTPIKVPVVRLNEFLPDSQAIAQNVIVGTPGWPERLDANKNAFALEFVQRSRFTTAFPSNMSPEDFVNKLVTNAGITLDAAERASLVNELSGNNTATGRASVLRKVAEDAELVSIEKNKAFVLMQYFGYMRRNPNDPQDTDHSGYNFWLSKLNQFNGDFRAAQMVFAFLDSFEYRDRFLQP